LLDALISALVARAAACGYTALPSPGSEAAAAASEGWIHLPTTRESLDLLSPNHPAPFEAGRVCASSPRDS
jgi:hypothetical protein